MGILKIQNCSALQYTLIDNTFIDSYMAKANGEYVKVYLLLLRHMSSSSSFSVSELADALENTEGDILRALKYWAKEGLLSIEYDASGTMTGLFVGCGNAGPKAEPSVSVPAADVSDGSAACVSLPESDMPVSGDAGKKAVLSHPDAQPDAAPSSGAAVSRHPVHNIGHYKSRKEFKQLLFIAERYIGRTLSPSDVEMLTYFYDTLQFSADLVEYLIEYCVENGHKSMHYIKSVALAWADAGIETVSEARRSASFYNKDCSAVLKAFGITGRMAAAVETDFVKKWTSQFGFTLDIIVEACSRTVSAIHQPSFEYADKILSNWHNKGVRHLADVAAIDAAYLKKRAEKNTAPAPAAKKTKFNNFEERSYDMDDLERQLLQS